MVVGRWNRLPHIVFAMHFYSGLLNCNLSYYFMPWFACPFLTSDADFCKATRLSVTPQFGWFQKQLHIYHYTLEWNHNTPHQYFDATIWLVKNNNSLYRLSRKRNTIRHINTKCVWRELFGVKRDVHINQCWLVFENNNASYLYGPWTILRKTIVILSTLRRLMHLRVLSMKDIVHGPWCFCVTKGPK